MEIPLFVETSYGKVFGIFHKGEENKELIVLVHGYNGNHLGTWNRSFVKLARLLNKDGCNVFRFDFISHGNSEDNPKAIIPSAQAKQLLEVLEKSKKSSNLMELY